jgi:nicotinamide phosphoribosyltransferase
MKKNIILCADSYKSSHCGAGNNNLYPPGAEAMESYIEARAGSHLVFFGLQMFIQDYLMNPITQADIDEAAKFFDMHGEPFDREMWEYILAKYNGYLPVRIFAVPEGTVVQNRNIVAKILCYDPRCFSVASYLETCFLRGIWYPSSVATYSYDCKQVIKQYHELTSDHPEGVVFKLHDFGGRGVSSGESAAIGGCAHLVNFMGSDTVEGIVKANQAYGCESGMAGYSIPATEHSTITSWGKENEVAAYENFMDKYLKPGKICACVSDSYGIMNAVDIYGTVLKDKIQNSGGTFVVRPDSGDPAATPVAVIEKLAEYFGTTTNSKGFKVLPDCIRVIQGDGINKSTIEDILSMLKWKRYAADNIAFGMGGQLLQIVNRDTYGFAMKCSAIKINGEWQDVYKEAPGKNSKKGRLTLVLSNGEYQTRRIEDCKWADGDVYSIELKEVFRLVALEGLLEGLYSPWYQHQTLDEIRARAI